MPDLHLNLKGEYFDQIKAGEKVFEFRELSLYWKKRLEGKEFDSIILKRGYPKSGDSERTITRPWKGYQIMRIEHKHFNHIPTSVFAIRVN